MSVHGSTMSSRFRNRSSACSRSCQAGAPQCLSVGLGFEEAMRCLQKIGEGSFMMKTCGLTVLRKTALGRFYIDGGVLIDSLSGVRFMMKNLKLVMFRCPVLGGVRVAWTTLESQVLAGVILNEVFQAARDCQNGFQFWLACRTLR